MRGLVEVPKSKVYNELANGVSLTAIYSVGKSTIAKCKFNPKDANAHQYREFDDFKGLVTNSVFLKNLMKREDVKFFKVVEVM